MLCAILVALPGVLLSACTGTSPPTRFYALEAGSSVVHVTARPDLSIGLGPVTLPESLDRPQILVRPEPYRRELAEFDHWAGSLRENLTRVLAIRLGKLLGSQRVFLYPWPRFRHVDLQVQIEIWRFEGRLGGEAELVGNWTLLDETGERVLHLDPIALRRPVPGSEYRDLVAAMSDLVSQLAEHIANTLTELAPRGVSTGQTQLP